jgi:hypothetical protein
MFATGKCIAGGLLFVTLVFFMGWWLGSDRRRLRKQLCVLEREDIGLIESVEDLVFTGKLRPLTVTVPARLPAPRLGLS